MRSPNNVLFTAVQALFNETLYLKCPDMRCPGYTPAPDQPDGEQCEYNIPLDDDEFGGNGGGPLPLYGPAGGPRPQLPPWQPPQSGTLGIHRHHPVRLITLLLLYLPAYLLRCTLTHLAHHQGILLPQVPTMTMIGSIVNRNNGNISGSKLLGNKV
jgi:hypothetical protein